MKSYRLCYVIIKKGSYVWGGTPGQTNFYTTTADIMSIGNDATQIFQGLQVAIPDGYKSYRIILILSRF